MGGRRSLLLVEDEAILAMGTVSTLGKRGYSVEHVFSGESALARVAASPEGIDLILMDINLGRGMSGTEAARQILRSRDIPIVFLSSHTEESIVESTEEISSYGYVVKNSGITVLDASIRMAFRLFEARKSINAKNMAIEAANEQLRVTVEELTASNRKLALSEDKFLKAFRLSPDSITINRLSDGVFIDTNSGFTEMTGYSRGEVVGRSSLPGDIGIWARSEDRETLVRGLRESDEAMNMETQFRRKDGSLFTGMMSAKIIEIEGEIYTLAITRDITERKLADDLIKDSESRFRAAFANAPVGMALLSISGDLRMMNRSFSDMLGCSMTEATSVDFKSHMHPGDLALCEDAVKNLLSGSRGTMRFVARYFHKGGGVVWVDESVSLLRNESGEAQGLIIHALDISERKLGDEKAGKLNRVRAAVSEVMQLIVRETDVRRLLDDACRIAVSRGGLRMAWIGLVDEEGSVARPFSSAGAVEGYLGGLTIPMTGSPAGMEPAEMALREGRLSVIADIEGDQRAEAWRERALARGYRSMAGFPLRSGPEIVGVFGFYSGEPDFFGPEETDLLAQLALDVSFALESAKSRELREYAELRLKQSDKLYRESFEKSSAAKLLIDPETSDIVDANLAASKFYGYAPERLVKMRMTDINVAPPDETRADLRRVRDNDESRFYFRHRLASGELREVEVFSSPIDVGDKVFLHSIVHDVSDQMRIQAELRASETRFRTAIERAPVGMALTAPDGRFSWANGAFADMVGRSAEELSSLPYASITHPDDLGPSDECARACLSGERASARLVKRYIHKDGHAVWADVSIALVRDERGEPAVFITHMLDISERKRSEEALQRLLVEKDTLMKELQHRVKNNLNVVTSLLELENRKSVDSSASKVLSEAIARVRSISAIYERLYLSEDPERVDLALYVQDLAKSLFSTYNLDPGRVALRIRADRVLLDTRRSVPLGLILNELLSNALKYAYAPGERGEVRVDLSRDDGTMSLAVSDDGAGIPDRYLASESASMGMTLVRLLTEQLDAELSIENRGGTRVLISFSI
jgi:PAS domain S-box-containing protein